MGIIRQFLSHAVGLSQHGPTAFDLRAILLKCGNLRSASNKNDV